MSKIGCIAAIAKNNVILIDIENNIHYKLTGHSGWINSLEYSSDETQLLTASDDGSIRLWDIRKYLHGRNIKDSNPNSLILYNNDGTKFLLSSGNKLKQEVSQNIKQINFDEIKAIHPGLIKAIAYSPNGKMYASASKGLISLWDSRVDTLLCMLRGPLKECNSLCFIDSKRLIAAYENGTIRIWNLNENKKWDDYNKFWALDKPAYEWQAHDLSVNSISISPNGKYIVSASSDKKIKVWNLTAQLIKVWEAHSNKICFVRFSPNGKYIVSASLDGTIKTWNTNNYEHYCSPIHLNKDIRYTRIPIIISSDEQRLIAYS